LKKTVLGQSSVSMVVAGARKTQYGA
jgi:hypothetical protein